MPGFVPFMDMNASLQAMRMANTFSLNPSHLAKTLCSVAVLLMGLSTFREPLRR